jgi:hypothetical protein
MKIKRMSLEKESFTVALSLSVSLSHFSFVETCVHPASIVGSPDSHSHWRVGRGFNGGGLSRREGRFSLIYFSKVSPGGRGASSVIYFSEVLSAMRAGGGTERAASFGWRAPCPGHTHLGSSARRTSPGLRQDQRGPVRRRQTLFCADTLCPLIPVACRGRLPVL